MVITQGEWGGAQRFIHQLISGLDKNRFDIQLAIGNDHHEELASIVKDIAPVHILHQLRREPSITGDMASIKELQALITELRPDILFLNSSKAGFNGAIAAARATHRPKVVYRIGGWAFNDPWPLWKKIFYFGLEYISASWKDIIIVNSKHDYDQALSLGIAPRSKLVSIHNGIDIQHLHFLDKEEARKIISPKTFEGLWLGVIANFYPTKGLAYLIEALRILKAKNAPAHHLFLIGDGQERNKLGQMILEYGLQERITMLGKLSDAYRYLPAFDIGILPSVKEGFPWVLLEEMAAKLPIIATRVGAASEILEHDKDGIIVDKANAGELARAIELLLHDAEKRKTLGDQAFQRVQSEFTLQQMMSRYTHLLENLVKKN